MKTCNRCQTEWPPMILSASPSKFTIVNGELEACPDCPESLTIRDSADVDTLGYKPGVEGETSGYLDLLDD